GTALRSCLAGGRDVRCPQPSERYIPGTLRGTLAEPLAANLTVTLTDSPDGVLDVTGSQPVRASSFRRLTFTNQPVGGRGRVIVPGTDLGEGGDGRSDREINAFGHGTAMASIMVARAGLFGITGLAPGAKILPIAVPLTGTTDAGQPDKLPDAIRYAADHHAKI